MLGELLSKNNPSEAIVLFRRSLAVSYSEYQAQNELGVAYERLGDYATAWVYYKREHHFNYSYALHCIVNIEQGNRVIHLAAGNLFQSGLNQRR